MRLIAMKACVWVCDFESSWQYQFARSSFKSYGVDDFIDSIVAKRTSSLLPGQHRQDIATHAGATCPADHQARDGSR
ncbi:hypothetical protein [Novosphingobium taihuense]|uniref:hypothetical protein n=1 Tax=Novosphingobium taihuense TaxID=260085 RepID=UPI0011A8C06C|nr:hypothetical protein [Novosphingobium taihuense]